MLDTGNHIVDLVIQLMENTSVVLRGRWMCFCLFNFLFQSQKQIRMEEFIDCDTQSVAQLFDGGNGSTVVSAADDIVHSGLCHAAHAAELVE